MAQLILDKLGRFRSPPAFLALSSAKERSVARLAVFLIAAIVASLAAALVVGLIVTACAAAQLARRHGVSIAQGIELAVSPTGAARPLLSYWYELSVAGLASYAAALAVLALACWVYRRNAQSFLTAAPRFRWNLLLGGAVFGAVVVAVAIAIQPLLSTEELAPPLLRGGESLGARLGYAGLAAGCLFLAALAEEIIFRGVLLQLSAAFTRSLPLILAVNGLIFSLVHFDPDLSAFVIRLIMGAGWAWIALRTGGIEATTGVHLANNLLITLFVTPVSFKSPTARDLDLGSILVEIAMVVVFVIAAEVWARRRERRSAAGHGALAPVEEAG
ncbi:type II CAAX endopeptidase family protein [Phenylobacterium sp. LjRoot219]|uniref:CPBP family intramembrane glutamic endopeptidase n=1 Tax=Phenylobacterium sp. LjRoot219 TaxID=3342283 RepID=UPI003ECEAF7C